MVILGVVVKLNISSFELCVKKILVMVILLLSLKDFRKWCYWLKWISQVEMINCGVYVNWVLRRVNSILLWLWEWDMNWIERRELVNWVSCLCWVWDGLIYVICVLIIARLKAIFILSYCGHLWFGCRIRGEFSYIHVKIDWVNHK